MTTRWSIRASLALALLAPSPALAIDAFLGRYVGSAELVDIADPAVEERDVTTMIEAYGEGGFAVSWTSVIRVDGRRDVPGVRHVERTMAFTPVRGGDYYLQAPDYDPFRVREMLEPMTGDALAWANVDGDTLDIWVFALTAEGEGELQQHRRVLTEYGLDLLYRGYLAGALETSGEGRMVRVD